jgi:hypothetical protein
MMEENEAIYGETFEVRFVWSIKRHHPRYPLKAPVHYVVEEERQPEAEQAEGRDISLGGVGVQPPETDESIPPVGSRVRLKIAVEGIDKPFNLEGEVVHADPESGFGVRFANLPTSLRQQLKLLLTMKALD